MKNKLLNCFTALFLLLLPQLLPAQKVAVNNISSQMNVVAPDLRTTACYALFTGNGYITNQNNSFVTGDIGTNLGTVTGFNSLNVVGEIHPIPDISTATSAHDLNIVYSYLDGLAYDILLANPPLFGNNMILNAQVYLLNAATILTGNLYLDAQGNADGVFVIHIAGALTTTINSKVILSNGAQAKNVYWKVNGAVSLGQYTSFAGTIISKDGAISMDFGSTLEGRALTTNGAINTNMATVTITAGCNTLTTSISDNKADKKQFASLANNQANKSLVVVLNEDSGVSPAGIRIYNTIGKLIDHKTLTSQTTVIPVNFPAGIYFYHILRLNATVQTGKFTIN